MLTDHQNGDQNHVLTGPNMEVVVMATDVVLSMVIRGLETIKDNN